jgi:type II secretory pathway pseudopilin PulG
MDAGGLAQMSYNNFHSSNGLGVPGSGFASRRGNGPNIKRLSFEPTKQTGPLDSGAPTPRTSRSHLLAGLRTAPKSARSSDFPSTAPPTTLQHPTGLGGNAYLDNDMYGGPKTSTFAAQNAYNQMNRHMYSVPEQILAPPEILIDEQSQEQMDPNLYAQLVATNLYLAEQQQRLQQQLLSVQAAAQQFQGMSLGMGQGQQFATPPATPQILYQQQQQQQAKNNMQPIISPVPGAQPGVFSYYNPITGQQSYFMDNSAQQPQYLNSQVAQQQANYSPPQQPGTPRFQVSPPPQSDVPFFSRSVSPPKKSTSPPQDHAPLPPPSAGAFRRGHRKNNSMALTLDNATSEDGPKSAALPKTAGFPMTPGVAGFGPGQARAGEHPVRQPRGPPPLDEIIAKPTTKFEGSKNFAARTRRNAVHNLVRAGMERRRAPGSSGSTSPVSPEHDIVFSVSSDNDSDSIHSGSGSLSGPPARGSPRTSLHGAIGSERPSSRQKQHAVPQKKMSTDSYTSVSSAGSEESPLASDSFAAVFKNGGKKPEVNEVPRKAPMLVLTSADKRKNAA